MNLRTVSFLLGAILLSALAPTASAQAAYSLQQCRQMALENNKQMGIMSQKMIQATEERKAAATKRLPSISATGAYLFNSRETSLIAHDMMLPIGSVASDGSFTFTPDQVNNSFTTIDGQVVPLDASGQPFDPRTNPEKILWKQYTTIPKDQLTFDTRNVFAGAITLAQPVYMGGKIQAYNRIARMAETLSVHQRDAAASQVILSTDQAYWGIVSLTHKKHLAESLLALLEKLQKDVAAMKREGVATRSDELSVEVQLNQARMSLTQVEDGLTLSKMNLAMICGLPLGEDFTLSDSIAVSQPDPAPITDVQRAVENRQEIQSLTLAVDMYREKENVTRSDYLPSLALTGSYLLSSPNLYNGFSFSPKGMFNLGVMLKVPIFSWNERGHKMKIARADTEIARLELDEAKEKVELQIHQSEFYLNSARKKAEMTASNLAKAVENLRQAQLSFREGVATLTNVFEAQTAWLSASSQQIDAQIDLTMARAYLLNATGQLVPSTL